MTSLMNTSNFSESISEKAQNVSKINHAINSPIPSLNVTNQNDSIEINDDNSYKSKKKAEICDVHSKAKIADSKQIQNEKQNSLSDSSPNVESTDIFNQKEMSSEACVTSKSPNCTVSDDILLNTDMPLESTIKENQKSKPDRTDSYLSDNNSNQVTDLRNFNQESGTDSNSLKSNDCMVQNLTSDSLLQDSVNGNICKNEQKFLEKSSISSLPDIVSTINKPTSETIHDSGFSSINLLSDNADLDEERSQKSKSLLSQKSYSSLFNSEAMHNEMENELRHLNNLHSLQTNQSIYKLAYDENVTDQSEADSRSPSPVDPRSPSPVHPRSPSPVDPDSFVPSSLTSSEIIVHEADSGSEAGSEDLELIPHRYECETSLNKNRHIYMNKLSLAVELLRTRESLPYDKEFKRIVGDNDGIPGVHESGKSNLGFMDDTCSSNSSNVKDNVGNKCTSSNTHVNEVVSKNPTKDSVNNINDSASFRDIEFDEDELSLEVEDAAAEDNSNQNKTAAVRSGYRRFGVQAQNYFPQRVFPLNPCFCCIIM